MKVQKSKSFLGYAKKFFIPIFLTSMLAEVSAENFRVRTLIPVELSEISEQVTVKSGINDALFITLPEDLTYVSGVEIKLKVPEEIVAWRDSVAYMFYDNLIPEVQKEETSYFGERLYLSTIPGNFSLMLYLPLSNEFSIKDSPYSVKIPLTESFKNSLSQNPKKGIFLRFMMVMKGVPESLEEAELEISTKCTLKDKGKLSLSVNPKPSAEKSYSVFIDDLPSKDYGSKMLETGEHHLSIVSDSFRNEVRTFMINQAKTTSLSVSLRGVEPLLRIVCPAETKVWLDGKELKSFSEPVSVQQGEHTVKFALGGYEVIKSVSAMNGRTYSVSLSMDATVSEEK